MMEEVIGLEMKEVGTVSFAMVVVEMMGLEVVVEMIGREVYSGRDDGP